MAFSLNKYDIPAEIKKEIMDMYASETDAYDTQIKDLNKKTKQYSDYDELKSKVSTYESEIETIKNQSKTEILNFKKQYAYETAIKASNVSNDKLVRKLLSLDELTFDEEKNSFIDFGDKLKTVCDEYGISIETPDTKTETSTDTKSDNKVSNILSSIFKSPELPTNTTVTNPIEKKPIEMSFVEQLALDAKARNEKNAELSNRASNNGNANFINSFLKQASIKGKK